MQKVLNSKAAASITAKRAMNIFLKDAKIGQQSLDQKKVKERNRISIKSFT